jgi:hypothetical protein
MSIEINDNILISAGKPIEVKYLNSENETYVSVAAANAAIPISLRHAGLTVNVNNVEYWYKEGLLDTDLIEKKYDTVIPLSDYVTGGTNMGFYSGPSGVLKLPIDHLTNNDFDGEYNSLYNNYYRSSDGYIRVGIPSDGIGKRGFVKYDNLTKSWIWNEYVGGGDLLGWLFIDGDISTKIGTFQSSGQPQYYDGVNRLPYTNTSFTPGVAYSNGSHVGISSVIGDLTTGGTVTIGARVFKDKTNNNLNFKTVISNTPSIINVYEDESFVRISGKTTTYGMSNSLSVGVGVYSGTSNNNFVLKRLRGSGNTNVVDYGDSVVIHSTGGITTPYNCQSPSSICVGGIPAGTTLTGRNTFNILEQLLVPTLYPTLTNPSVTLRKVINNQYNDNTIFEIGTNFSNFSLAACYNKGCINPQYSAVCDKRAGDSAFFNFSGDIANISEYSPGVDANFYDVSSYIIRDGIQRQSVSVNYSNGVQPYDSKGNIYSTPLACGDTMRSDIEIHGILPWYWGLSESRNVNSLCVSTYGYNGLGGKCVENVTNSPIIIPFESTGKYIWFALPACSDIKSCWYINGGNGGGIGGVEKSNLFDSPYEESVSSWDGLWNNCKYDVYVSWYETNTSSNNPIIIT